MKWSIVISVVLLLVVGVAFGVNSYQKYHEWDQKVRGSALLTPSVKDYDELISNMQKGIKDLKAEKEELRNAKAKETFVSLWALEKAGREQERIYGERRTTDDSGFVWFISGNSVCIEQFDKWIEAALKLDAGKKH